MMKKKLSYLFYVISAILIVFIVRDLSLTISNFRELSLNGATSNNMYLGLIAIGVASILVFVLLLYARRWRYSRSQGNARATIIRKAEEMRRGGQ